MLKLFIMQTDPKFKKIAILAAKNAGKIIAKRFKKKIKISRKKDLTFLTEVDLLVNDKIISIIKRNFPSHNIISEESGGSLGKEFTWVIDPVDGTTNYVLGFPFFAVSLALVREKEPILAIVFNPITQMFYLAEKGKGAYLNGKKIEVSQVKNLSRAALFFDRGTDLPGIIKIVLKIISHIRIIRLYGSSCLDSCSVASGKCEAFLNSKAYCHDIISGALIVKEAGGKVTDFKGRNWQIGSDSVLMTNGKIHNQLLKLINIR